MKLEYKLTLSTGALILASLLSAYSAHVRIQEASRLSVSVTSKRIPVFAATRELRVQILSTVHSLEAYMLFGVDPASAGAQRQSRQEHFALAEASMGGAPRRAVGDRPERSGRGGRTARRAPRARAGARRGDRAPRRSRRRAV